MTTLKDFLTNRSLQGSSSQKAKRFFVKSQDFQTLFARTNLDRVTSVKMGYIRYKSEFNHLRSTILAYSVYIVNGLERILYENQKSVKEA